uniref:C2H2-type domain-containing protein n=1 Tax=viral metagenome TaxID=1070528 RepID=A0A6C0IH93_9ZZZZ
MTTNDNEFVAKSSFIFYCENCDYGTCKKSNIDKHYLTSKHTKTTLLTTFDNTLVAKSSFKKFSCEKCDKYYNDRAGLWRHNKKCLNKNKNTDDHNKPENKDELINYLIKENTEFKNLILEIVKKDTTQNNITNNNNTITNSHNKTFNLQFFLNETCKNAMNISDFVDSIKLQLSDLENVAKIGYVEGLSKIIIKNLNALDVTERPVHCSDSKRDTMYVKDDDKWEKENETNEKVLKAIEDIANKNSKMVKEWKQKNPECSSSKSHKADVYSHIMIQAVCSNNDTNNNKILKKIAKEVIIDKK